jgi:hypothetical protein
MGWTQTDSLYRFSPDRKKTNPRRANLYQFSLSNPNRYLDPDGHETPEAYMDWLLEIQAKRDGPEPLGPSTKPAEDTEHTVDEAHQIEESLGFDPEGHGEITETVLNLVFPGIVAQFVALDARSVTANEFPTAIGHNDEADAFRHAYASYVLTKQMGRGFAQTMGDAHERSEPTPLGERVMDLYNNHIGRKLALDSANKNRDPAVVVHEAVNNGLLMVKPLNVQGNPISGEY